VVTPNGSLSELLAEGAIRLDAAASSRPEAIRLVGRLLVECGAVTEQYIDGMLSRDESVSTWVGEGIAFPHGTLAAKDAVLRDAIAVARFPEGVEWGGERVQVAVGIAARGRGHIRLLSRLATVLVEPAAAARLRGAIDEHEVRALLAASETL
jgi:PTS system mannitol-specific IIA component